MSNLTHNSHFGDNKISTSLFRNQSPGLNTCLAYKWGFAHMGPYDTSRQLVTDLGCDLVCDQVDKIIDAPQQGENDLNPMI